MNPSSLETLHKQFSDALKAHAYMGEAAAHPNTLEKTDTKSIRLQKVFELARRQINADLKQGASPLSSGKQLNLLKELEEDGKAYYTRYEAASKSWTRILLKAVAYYTPALLKNYLPACFSNRMAEAEVDTKKEYEAYKKLIRFHVQKLSKQAKLDDSPKADKKSPKVVDQYKSGTEDLSDEDLNKIYEQDEQEGLDLEDAFAEIDGDNQGDEAKRKREAFLKGLEDRQTKAKTDQADKPKIGAKSPDFFDLDVLDDDLLNDDKAPKGKPAAKLLKPTPTPASQKTPAKDPVLLPAPVVPTKDELELKKQKTAAAALQKVEACMKAFKQFDQLPLSLDKFKELLGKLAQASKEVVELDPDNGKAALDKAGIPEADLKVLSEKELLTAVTPGNDPKLADLLKPTQWNDAYTKAEAQKGFINFGIRKLLGKPEIMLKSDQGVNVKEAAFKDYRGKVRLVLGDDLNELADLAKFLEANPTCRPCTIELNFKGKQATTAELIKLLLSLSDYSAEIQINGMEEINFKAGGIEADAEHQFIQRLDHFAFKANIILSDHDKKDWSAAEFSALLALDPTVAKARELCALCAAPKEIALPAELLALDSVDFEGFTPDLIEHILPQFSHAQEINFSGCAVSDKQLAQWIANKWLANVKTLHLNNCKELTTDILHNLMTLPNLASLALPDLPKGKESLDKLPAFDNPFKINLFYTASKATHSIAAERYTGPLTWAPAFQIPLARQKATMIFTPRMNTLDPKSVAYWLHNRDYEHLAPQEAVRNILADSNAGLTDDNIVEFLQKFPGAQAVSLFNCPNVTSEGIIKLLKACPKIRTLDLTGCPHITEALFLDETNLALLKQLSRIIITDTGISSSVAQMLQEDVFGAKMVQGKLTGGALEFEETTLTLTDADLTDDQALDKLLKEKTLNTLKRINLDGCTKLTNAMLGQLLDHLNADIWVKNKEGVFIDNPQRLNLAVLNLTGCSEITEEAFHDKKGDDEKIVPKHLGNLDRVITGGTKIDKILQEVYPKVTFQEHEEPVTIAIDPDSQLQLCQLFTQTQDPEAKQELAATHVSDRIVVELFGSDCTEQTAVDLVRTQPIDTADEQFCDITLTFKTTDDADPAVYYAHRDVLYSRSLYFVNGFRPGGLLCNLPGLDYINVHATEKASKAIMDMLYGKLVINDLDWETAADAAELAGRHIFKLRSFRPALLERFHSQFEVNRAEKMLTAARLLEDKEGIDYFEELLVTVLDSLGAINSKNRNSFQALANIAKNHNLTTLRQKTDLIEVRLTKRLEHEFIKEQNDENEKLIKQLMATDKLSQIV